ncbi:prolyl oligopeptidase family serine peptidase [Aquimarina sp. U1-2]|uniref:prolyl oligopeptidase family serine peptidase n=1 Tax=Aquimarina sp. U1-2 TaxID=2823141 RepID=UPI001AEC932D|nr:prolyl oligopeptidase family serine peptidase [Aquimarina sp. U1-2]MBP2834211.1 prolyl oligopeptidase family serine peptidase [Aquimarina sp. U1-2]
MNYATTNYHGLDIIDKFRDLENLKDPNVINWLNRQDSLAEKTLNKLNNKREQLIAFQKQFDKNQEFKISWQRRTANGTYFFLKQRFDEKYSKLYFRSSYEVKDSLVFDPSTYKNGTDCKINYIRPDWDGNQIVVSLSKPGKEISELMLIDLKTKKKIFDISSNAAPASLEGIRWLSDNSGFIYQRTPKFKNNDSSYFHNTKAILYTIASKNHKILFSRATHPELNLKPEDFPIVSYNQRDDQYLSGIVAGPTPYADTYYANINELNNSKINWKFLFSKQEKIKKHIYKEDSILFLTSKGASNFKICKTSLKKPNFANPITMIPEKKNEVITSMAYTNHGLFYTTLKNGVLERLFRFSNNKETEIELPQISGRVIIHSDGLHSTYLQVITTGWTSPFKRYLYDFRDNRFIPNDISTNNISNTFGDIQVKELEIESHDGTMVPLSIIHNAGIKMDGSNPTLIRGYGSYGSSIKPTFYPSTITWLKEGGILVYAHVRGGGEKGNDWYEDGYKTAKPNTWKDVIACTEYLINKGYTSKDKTAILGSSAGGILMGRAITERPDLYRVAIGDVPSMNMIRSEIGSNGSNSVKEFGSVKDSIEFRALLEMDSYHNIEDNTRYPAVLIASSYNDYRVPVWSPAKFVARLQEATISNKPVLFSVDFESGHSTGNNKMKMYQKYADFYTFILWQTGHPDYQPE